MGIILLIGGAIAAGIFAVLAVVYTFKWLKERIKKAFREKNLKKVAALPLEKLIDECDNTVSLDQFLSEGITDVIAYVDNNGQVESVDLIQNTGEADPEISRLLGSNGMVVITG